MRDLIRFGVIGCGGISRWHIHALNSIPLVKLTAVCDERPDKARAAGESLGAAFYTDANELMRSGLVDAVCICTPSGLHSDLCVNALRNGLHVVVEKPLAITRDSLREVLEAEARSEKKLMVIAQLRYGEDIKRVKTLLESGSLGKITMVDLSMKYFREPAYFKQVPWRGTLAMDGGGALMNQGIHGIDLLCWLCGGVEQVHCFSKTLAHEIEAEDTLSAAFSLLEGGLGVLSATTSCYPGHERRLEICGTQGSLRLVEDTLVQLTLANGETYEKVRSQTSGASDPFAINYELHKRQLEDFAVCIQNGAPSPLDGTAASAALHTIFSLYESAVQNTPITVMKKEGAG